MTAILQVGTKIFQGSLAEIDSLTPERTKRGVDDLISSIRSEKDPLLRLDRFAEFLPLEKLEEAARLEFEGFSSSLETAKSLLKEAEAYLKTVERAVPFRLQTKISSLLDTLISVLESFLTAFGLAEFFKPPENDMHADIKAQKVMLLMSLFTMVTAVLLPIAGAAISGMIVGGAILAIAALSLIYPVFRPPVANLPKGENWTREYREGRLEIPEGRNECVREIAQTLIASQTSKIHVMLLGKSGVGKTETVKSLVEAIERGDYPELKGKKVFYFNTADLVNNTEMFTEGNRVLSRISKEMGRHREKYILIFDEIHMACRSGEAPMAEQLKTMLDNMKGNFPYVIGITTEEDYYQDIYAGHSAFARRFHRIALDSAGDAETLKILNGALLKSSPKMILDPGILRAIVEKSKEAFGQEAPQPYSSLKVLSRCIQKCSELQRSPLEKRVEELRIRIRSFYLEGAVQQGRELLSCGRRGDGAELEEELGLLEARLKSEKGELERLFQSRDLLAAAKKEMFKTALKIGKIRSPREKDLTAFLFLSHFLAPSLEAELRREGGRLGVDFVLSEPLVERVIAEELEQERRAQEAIERGREQIESRKRE